MSTFGKAPRFGPVMDITRTSRKGRSGGSSRASGESVSGLLLDAEALGHARKLKPPLSPSGEKTYVNRFLGLTGARPVDASGPIHFGQRSVNPQFSDNQASAAGTTIHSQAERLRTGAISPDAFPVTFASIDRKRVTMNNRSLTTLSLAGMAPTRTINATGRLPASGDDSAAALLERIHETGTVSQTSMPIRAGKARTMTGTEETVPLFTGRRTP
jgi:hypothetical protein